MFGPSIKIEVQRKGNAIDRIAPGCDSHVVFSA